MPRTARKTSKSGIYHIMLRGINHQQIFEDDEDNDKFLQVIRECKAISNFELYAYCLMGNHIHLLIKTVGEPLEQVFKRIGSRFVYWYNIKHQRIGHLFQDRYKSEPVENEKYLLTVVRYIHQNPVKAGICCKTENYQYSSYLEYLESNEKTMIDSSLIFEMVSKEEFINYHNELNDDKCLEMEAQSIRRLTDEEAKAVIKKYTKCENVSEFQKLNTKVRDIYIGKLKQNGLSIRQICRLTGVSFGIARKI